MRLRDELHFSAELFTNINLDPTRRYGWETSATYVLSETVQLASAASYTRAVFREGIFAGNDVPLVSHWTGNVGLSWDICHKFPIFDAASCTMSAIAAWTTTRPTSNR